MSKHLKGNTFLLLTALIWGTTFVAQRKGMDYIGPFTYTGIRSLVGCLVLIPIIILFSKLAKKNEGEKAPPSAAEKAKDRKVLIIGGISCGAAVFTANSLQQIGLVSTTAGKAGFITALYIIIVPIFGIFLKRKIRPIVWLAAVLGIFGLYLLSIKSQDGFSISKGDFFVLLSAFAFAVHILVVDHFSPKADGIKLSCIQFLSCGLIAIPFMLILEHPQIPQILACWLPILYAGVISCGGAYTFQILGQKYTEPTVASLILSLESVFAAIAGALLLGETMMPREVWGCVIVFTAIILAQLPSRRDRLPAKN